jgi:phosphomannomutase
MTAGLHDVTVEHEPTAGSRTAGHDERGGTVGQVVETDVELVVDGVKVRYDDGWVLVLPDPEAPITHVWAEAGSEGDARRRCQEHMGRIRRLLG